MNVLLIIAIGVTLLLIASRTYPFWIARVFREDDSNPPPSQRFADGRDYVKSPTQVVFAHHFASIAGAGPIIGPILALAFGWGPAWLWIILGAIAFGAVHDMSAMFMSVREGGKTIAEIARRTLGAGGFILLIVFLILVLCLINAIFLNLSATALTSIVNIENLKVSAEQTVLRTAERDGITYAQIGGIATTSVFIMTGLAPILGLLVYRRVLRGLPAFAVAAVVCAGSIVLGFIFPIDMLAVAEYFHGPDETAVTQDRAHTIWRIMLAAYVFIGCWIPVWLILQPRDFTNVQILYGGMILLFIGMIVAGGGGAGIEAERFATLDEGAAALGGPLWPFLFITIACGAISGFHSVVATGTTVKQLPRESDCRRIGYNAMLLESLLAMLVLLAVASQIPRESYFSLVWPAEGGGNPVLAFALGCGQVFANLGIPLDIGAVLGILIIEGFLVTTLDTAVRLCRYLFEELWNALFQGNVPRLLRSRVTNTTLAVGGMVFFAFSAFYQQIWPIFGAGNQLIGALALTTVAIWLLQRRRAWLFAALPAAFMVLTTLAALWTKMWIDLRPDDPDVPPNYPLGFAGAFLLVLAVGFLLVAGGRLYAALRTGSGVRTGAGANGQGEMSERPSVQASR